MKNCFTALAGVSCSTFLSDLVIRDTVEEYPNARDFLALMASVERKMEGYL